MFRPFAELAATIPMLSAPCVRALCGGEGTLIEPFAEWTPSGDAFAFPHGLHAQGRYVARVGRMIYEPQRPQRESEAVARARRIACGIHPVDAYADPKRLVPLALGNPAWEWREWSEKDWRLGKGKLAMVTMHERLTLPPDVAVTAVALSAYKQCGLYLDLVPLGAGADAARADDYVLRLFNAGTESIRVYAGEGICSLYFWKAGGASSVPALPAGTDLLGL